MTKLIDRFLVKLTLWLLPRYISLRLRLMYHRLTVELWLAQVALLWRLPAAIYKALRRPDTDIFIASYHGSEAWLNWNSRTRRAMLGLRNNPGERIVWESLP